MMSASDSEQVSESQILQGDVSKLSQLAPGQNAWGTKIDRRRQAKYRVDLPQVMGYHFDQTRSKMKMLAITKPQNYIELRERVRQALVADLSVFVYETFNNVLVDGKIGDEQLSYFDANDVERHFVPNKPEPEVNEIALRIASFIDAEAKKCLEEILPESFSDLAATKVSKITQARNQGLGMP